MSAAHDLRSSARPKQRTTLKTADVDPMLRLEDIEKRGSIFGELATSMTGLLKRFGMAADATIHAAYAQATDTGRRPYQEDAVFVTDIDSSNTTLAILADGMGGHAAGDVASKLVIGTAAKQMIAALSDAPDEDTINNAMLKSIDACNQKISAHVMKNPETEGMGSTVVIAVIQDAKLYWASVGDSPLYLWRNAKCYQINQDHSMAPQIDQMAKVGILSVEDALKHPDRNCLTSALTGTPPTMIDAGSPALDLLEGDVILLSSDGLQFLSDRQIADIILKKRKEAVDKITSQLMTSVLDLDDPDQDSIGVIAIKLEKASLKHPSDNAKSAPLPLVERCDTKRN
jgi:serine/threonine protein phosphatase PrpC